MRRTPLLILSSLLAPSLLWLAACRRAPAGNKSPGAAKVMTVAPAHPVPVAAPNRTAQRALPPPSPAPSIPVKGPRPPRGTWLSLVYGGNGQGEIEPCG